MAQYKNEVEVNSYKKHRKEATKLCKKETVNSIAEQIEKNCRNNNWKHSVYGKRKMK